MHGLLYLVTQVCLGGARTGVCVCVSERAAAPFTLRSEKTLKTFFPRAIV